MNIWVLKYAFGNDISYQNYLISEQKIEKLLLHIRFCVDASSCASCTEMKYARKNVIGLRNGRLVITKKRMIFRNKENPENVVSISWSIFLFGQTILYQLNKEFCAIKTKVKRGLTSLTTTAHDNYSVFDNSRNILTNWCCYTKFKCKSTLIFDIALTIQTLRYYYYMLIFQALNMYHK